MAALADTILGGSYSSVLSHFVLSTSLVANIDIRDEGKINVNATLSHGNARSLDVSSTCVKHSINTYCFYG
jgi:hypothetical protein